MTNSPSQYTQAPVTTSKDASESDKDPCACPIEIHIENRGDVNINHNCGPGASSSCDSVPSTIDCYPPIAPGNTCLPPVAGRKQKSSPARKLQRLARNAGVPSVLAASTLQLVRRHLAGKPAANALESAAFGHLDGLPATTRRTLACALGQFDALPPDQREKVFDSSVAQGVDDAVDPDQLSKAFGKELVQRASIISFGVADASEHERPGLIRVFEPRGSGSDVEFPFVQVRICSVNSLRTQDFIPPLSPGALRPEEIANDCITTLVNERPQVNCQVRTTDCIGGATAGVCLRVPTITAGDGVVLEGVNFFSLDAKVRLTARQPATTTVELDAHVFGDLQTQVTETIDGETRLINDCRVRDRISVTLPPDLPPAIYDMQVIVPNITGIPALGQRLESTLAPIEVTPPPTARFQITSEKLICHEESGSTSFGSDEVGLRFVAVPLLADLSIGTPQVTSKRFGNVDSDDRRDIGLVVFDQRQPILAVAMSLLGHEVDGEDAYNNEVTKSTDVFVDLVKDQAKFVKDALAKAGIGLKDISKLGTTGAIVIGVAIAIVLVIDAIISIWAPADLIIEDPTGYTLLELAELTGADFPLPKVSTFSTEGDIDVTVTPQEKIPTQYREGRQYRSDDEDSRYEIVSRFNRTA